MKKFLMTLALSATAFAAFAAQPTTDDARSLVEQQAKTVFTNLNANLPHSARLSAMKSCPTWTLN